MVLLLYCFLFNKLVLRNLIVHYVITEAIIGENILEEKEDIRWVTLLDLMVFFENAIYLLFPPSQFKQLYKINLPY